MFLYEEILTTFCTWSHMTDDRSTFSSSMKSYTRIEIENFSVLEIQSLMMKAVFGSASENLFHLKLILHPSFFSIFVCCFFSKSETRTDVKLCKPHEKQIFLFSRKISVKILITGTSRFVKNIGILPDILSRI